MPNRSWKLGPSVALALVLAGPPVADSADSTRTAGWSVRMGWREPSDTARVRSVAADAPLEIGLTLSGADSLQGFQVEVRVRSARPGGAWSFTKSGECAAAVLEALVEGEANAPAPWRGKLVVSDAKALEDSTSRLLVLCAFNPEPLEKKTTYTLCRLRLRPPSAEGKTACPGWDTGARLELLSATALLPGRREVPIRDLGPPLELALRSAK